MKAEVAALVGAQYGSEGKGTIAYELANEYEVHIRTGAPNAGHTIRHEGRDWKMRSVPCGWVNPEALLVIGPGALVDAALLRAEVEAIEDAGYEVRHRLYVDSHATLIDPVRHHRFEGGVEGDAHEKIGSTGEGVGPARMARIARGTFNPASMGAWAKVDLVKDKHLEWLMGHAGFDTAALVNDLIESGASVLLEGTQGSGLSLIHGPWPYVTSTDTNAAQMLVDAGISPRMLTKVILVARTYPIRVAGNSGPLYNETSWEDLGFPEERTTVTKKVRRVGEWDSDLFARAAMLNQPCDVALTFADYLWPEANTWESWNDVTTEVADWIDDHVSTVRGVSDVTMIGVGPVDDRFKVIRVDG